MRNDLLDTSDGGWAVFDELALLDDATVADSMRAACWALWLKECLGVEDLNFFLSLELCGRGWVLDFDCCRDCLRVASLTTLSSVHFVSVFERCLAGLCCGICCIGLSECAYPGEFPWLEDCAFLIALASSKQNLRIFSWLRLYSPTVFHATICDGVGIGIVSVAMAISFFLITVFSRLGVSMVTAWGVYPVIVPSGIIFHWDANIGFGSLAFLIIVFRAMFFLLYVILVVLSPMEKCCSEGLILRVGVWLRGTFSESSESISVGVGGGFGDCDLYWMSSSSSEVASRLHSSSLVRASCLRSLLSKQRSLSFLYDRLSSDGWVTIFESSVFGFLPKCASNGVVLVVLLGISRIFSMMLASLELSVSLLQLGSMSKTAILRFMVWISLSTIPVPLWSPAGARISLYFCFCRRFQILFL